MAEQEIQGLSGCLANPNVAGKALAELVRGAVGISSAFRPCPARAHRHQSSPIAVPSQRHGGLDRRGWFA